MMLLYVLIEISTLLIVLLTFNVSCKPMHSINTFNGQQQQQANYMNMTRDDEAAYNKIPQIGELFEGDIVMDRRLRDAIWGWNTKRSSYTRSAKWPNGIIYYVIDPNFPKSSRRMLKEAMRQYVTRTCIRFKRRKSETDYVFFTAKGAGCWSYIGRKGGKQPINLGKNCHVIGSMEHEIMHALGFIHEHSRPDRDNYIRVNFNNIKRNEWHNFRKFKNPYIDNLKEEFNFASIMLYHNHAFSKNGRITIEAIGEPSLGSHLRFGQRRRFSIGDVKEINHLYNCRHYLKYPHYAGLFGEYHGNQKRKEIVERKKKLKDLLLASIFPEF